jgi:tryptophan 2,3-dioxygenase
VPGTGPGAPGRNFGEEGGRLTYGAYLRLPTLLDQQILESDPPARDELLFISIHQVYELWFKLLLHEMGEIRRAMIDDEVWLARHLFRRVHAVERILIDQIQILETMTPQDFLAFRAHLSPASGFQSVQFRELEFLSGAGDAAYVDRMRQASTAEQERMWRRLDEPSLWDAFVTLVESRGLPMTDPDVRRESLLAVARAQPTEYADLWDLAEGLLEHDSLASQWRSRHVDMVERQIGTKSGTGGSSGAPYLRTRLAVRYYPELWELRSYL